MKRSLLIIALEPPLGFSRLRHALPDPPMKSPPRSRQLRFLPDTATGG